MFVFKQLYSCIKHNVYELLSYIISTSGARFQEDTVLFFQIVKGLQVPSIIDDAMNLGPKIKLSKGDSVRRAKANDGATGFDKQIQHSGQGVIQTPKKSK